MAGHYGAGLFLVTIPAYRRLIDFREPAEEIGRDFTTIRRFRSIFVAFPRNAFFRKSGKL